MDGIMNLLHQVNDVHAAGRPDLFIEGKTKYTEIELAEILRNPQTPVFVGIDIFCDGNVKFFVFLYEYGFFDETVI